MDAKDKEKIIEKLNDNVKSPKEKAADQNPHHIGWGPNGKYVIPWFSYNHQKTPSKRVTLFLNA